MGVNALRVNLGGDTTRQAAQEFLNAYFQTFTTLAEYLELVREQTRKNGYTTTLFGRRRYFPAITSSVPHLRAQAERMAINAPVQGTAADVMRIAMNNVKQVIADLPHPNDARMLLQVHDELLLEMKTDVSDTVIPHIVAAMESVLDAQETYGVRLGTDTAIGDNWAELSPWQEL